MRSASSSGGAVLVGVGADGFAGVAIVAVAVGAVAAGAAGAAAPAAGGTAAVVASGAVPFATSRFPSDAAGRVDGPGRWRVFLFFGPAGTGSSCSSDPELPIAPDIHVKIKYKEYASFNIEVIWQRAYVYIVLCCILMPSLAQTSDAQLAQPRSEAHVGVSFLFCLVARPRSEERGRTSPAPLRIAPPNFVYD